ncbi:MAG: dethiobiotin synthase [Deltaproteobacteria bacterium]|nr:dethiobiotin synthase [Deltaproteobacteria bacterium]MBW2660773.1 dethiobiotin synthase [Deltaproteobacteria bacterium]
MIKQPENIFVVGTDTGVGKTVLSLLLMQFFYAKGYTPFYLKPVQTGCMDSNDIDSDARFIYKHVKHLKGKDPADSVIYCFKNPKAPYFAARDEKKKIDLNVIEKVVNEKSLLFSPLVIEAAGGLLVPVSEKKLMVDMIKSADARPVIAARAELGTINHTLSAIESLGNRGIAPAGVVFIDSGEKYTSKDMIKENIEAVERFSGIKVSGVISKIQNFAKPGQDSYRVVENLFVSVLAG